VIHIDEQLILSFPDDVRLLRVLLEPLYDAAGGGARLLVSTYGSDATASYAQLNTLPADAIAIDCASDPAICDEIAAHGSGKPLALGIVDGSPPPSAVVLAERVRRCLRRYPFDELILQPAAGLGRVPPQAAQQALARLVEVRALLA
jgi:methionine synthase II (cobalamin-independent)